MRKKEGKWKTLDGVLDEIWKMLNRGATHYHDPFHWPVPGERLNCIVGIIDSFLFDLIFKRYSCDFPFSRKL